MMQPSGNPREAGRSTALNFIVARRVFAHSSLAQPRDGNRSHRRRDDDHRMRARIEKYRRSARPSRGLPHRLHHPHTALLFPARSLDPRSRELAPEHRPSKTYSHDAVEGRAL